MSKNIEWVTLAKYAWLVFQVCGGLILTVFLATEQETDVEMTAEINAAASRRWRT